MPTDHKLKKFWPRRYYLFSKFDRGVIIDDESWCSITPEPMAKHMAQRVAERTGDATNENRANVLDAFCGVGSNLIQFGKKCGFCVASESDMQKIEYAKHNTQIYQLDEPAQVQFVHSDFLKLSLTGITFPQDKS